MPRYEIRIRRELPFQTYLLMRVYGKTAEEQNVPENLKTSGTEKSIKLTFHGSETLLLTLTLYHNIWFLATTIILATENRKIANDVCRKKAGETMRSSCFLLFK